MSLISSNRNAVKPESNNELKALPLPMQYMGGKGRIVNSILDGLAEHFPNSEQLIDLFAGSGVVSFHAKNRGYSVCANDIQPYSSTVLKSLISTPTDNLTELVKYLDEITDDKVFCGSRSNYLAEYFSEKSHISALNDGRFNWSEYKDFCESTDLFSGQNEDIQILKENESWCLFLAYYRNTYFGVKQCAEIDFLRELCEKQSPENKTHLLASVISTLTYCVSSTTHLAQYLKPSTEKNSKNLLAKRSISIISEVIKRLKLLTQCNSADLSKVLNYDFRDALENFDLSSNCIVYADPPYFKEHYSRYYHVLDTFVLYDYPELTFNKRLGETTKGRYREERVVSDFGKKSAVKSAFEDLFDSCCKYGNKLAISYACSSLVEKEYFYELAKKKSLHINILEFELTHTGQGQARHKQVTEYLFLISNEQF